MLVDTPVVVNVDKHVTAERAAVEESVALTNMEKVESWRAVTLGQGRCDHALQTAEGADSIPHVKECDYDGSCFRSSYPGAPWCEMCRTGFQDMSSKEPRSWATPLQAGAYT